MTRILVWGDLGPTGFGSVTADLGRAMLDLGHDLRFVSMNETGDDLAEPFLSRTFQVTAELADPARAAELGLGSQALVTAGVVGLLDGSVWQDGWTAEAAIVIGDFHGVEHFVLGHESRTAAFRKVPTYHYCPIEGVDLPPSWKRLWDVVHPVAMSEFGADQIKLVTGVRPPVVYHGVDTAVFRPVGEGKWWYAGKKLRTKADCRAMFGISHEARIVLRTDRHMPRKRYASLLRAMAPVMMKRPDVYLILHCRIVDQGGHLNDATSKLHPDLQRRIAFTDAGGGIDRQMLAALYNAADVYASPSAEGFGLTIAEAMACGIPAVGMDYSSVTEVIGPGGLLAPVNHLVDNEYDHAWAAVDERVFGQQVGRLLDDPMLRKQLGRAGRAHVLDKMQWSRAALLFSALMRPIPDQIMIPTALVDMSKVTA